MEDVRQPNEPADEEILHRIRGWHGCKWEELLRYVQAHWCNAGWKPYHSVNIVNEYHWEFHTWGLRYNESLIEAMRNNKLFWLMQWDSSHRGGHHIFKPVF